MEKTVKIKSLLGKRWSKELEDVFRQLLERAKPYNSLREFEKLDKPAYMKAAGFGIHRKIGEFYGWKMRKLERREWSKWSKDPEEVFQQLLDRAKPYSSLREFQRFDASAYIKACSLKMQRKIGEHYGWVMIKERIVNNKSHPQINWSKDPEEVFQQLLDRAKPYSSLIEFQRCDPAAYSKACTLEIHRKIGEYYGWKMRKKQEQWPENPEEVFHQLLERAKAYCSLSEFKRNDRAAYNKALSLGLHRNIGVYYGWEMVKVKGRWSKDLEEVSQQLLERAKRYSSLSEFKKNDRSAYKKAFSLGIHRDIGEIIGFNKIQFDKNIIYLWRSQSKNIDSPISHGITKPGLTSELSYGYNDYRIYYVHKECIPELTRPDVFLLTPIDGEDGENIARKIEASALRSNIGDKEHGVTISNDASRGRTEMRATSPIETLKLLLLMRHEIRKAGIASSKSEEDLHFMEARGLADVSDYVRISPLAKMSIFKQNGDGQRIIAQMIRTMEAEDEMGFMSDRETPMPDGKQILIRMKQAASKLGVKIPVVDKVELEDYKQFLEEKVQTMYFSDLQEFDWAGLIETREEFHEKNLSPYGDDVDPDEEMDIDDFEEAPQRRKMDLDVPEKYDIFHGRVCSKIMRGLNKGWIESPEDLLSGPLLDHVWSGIPEEDREILLRSIRNEVKYRADMGGIDIPDTEAPLEDPEDDGYCLAM